VLGEEVLELAAFYDAHPVAGCECLALGADPRCRDEDADGGALVLY
jgi:hypothetical protein